MGVRAPKPNDLVVMVLDWLSLHRIPAWRRNVGAARLKGGYWVRFGRKGQCDVWGILPGGLHVEIECKVGAGRLSAEQADWLAEVRAAGGVALVVRSIGELEAELKSLGVL